MPEQQQPLETWAIVEVMGHKKFAGFVTEQSVGGAGLIRVDVPETDQGGVFTKPYSKLIGVGSIYCITPCTVGATSEAELWDSQDDTDDDGDDGEQDWEPRQPS